MRAAWIALAVYVALLIAGLALAPTAIGSLLRRNEYGVQVSRRVQLGGRLQSLVGRLEELRMEGGGLAARLGRIQEAYEIVEPPAAGAGGEPGSGGAVSPLPASIFGATVTHGLGLERAFAADLDLVEARLERISAFERANPALSRATPARNPLRGEDFVRTSGFGRRRSPYTQALEFHAGLDLAAPIGTPIAAAADGVVTYAAAVEADRRTDWWRLGRVVAIRHGDDFVTLYGHCEKLLVRDGQRVRGGDEIATVGESGWSLGPHLHYEVRRRGEGGVWTPLDPARFQLDASPAPGEPEESASRPRIAPIDEVTPLLGTFIR